MALIQRLINITVTLAQNTQTNQPSNFAATGTNSVTLSGSRAAVKIQNSGNPTDCSAEIKVWGLQPSIMNDLSTLGLIWNLIPRNLVTVQAGDAVNGLSPIFAGQIIAAYGDYSAQPDVPFTFVCTLTAATAAMTPPPTSYPSSFDVATAMAGFARLMGVGFLNSGNVQITLPSMYFKGSAPQQAQKCADAANIDWGFPNGSALEIWPKKGSRTTPSVPVISPTGGMIDYPAFTQQGIIVKTLFNPLLTVGSMVKVQSSLLSAIAAQRPTLPNQANPSSPSETFPSSWAIKKLDLALDTMLPKGDWMSIVYAYNPGAANSIIPPQ